MMLRAHWSGYEIDSSEAAYNVQVAEAEKLGTLVRDLLGSGYFVRSYRLLSEESVSRLRDFVLARPKPGEEEAAVLKLLDAQIAKFNDRRPTTIGVRAIEPLLNYVGARRRELLVARTFRFDLTEEQREAREDYDDEAGFVPGSFVDETAYYSEWEIPWDGVVMMLGCQLVGVGKLAPDEQKVVYRATKRSYKESGLLDDLVGWGFGRSRDYVLEDIGRSQDLSLRVRLNPDAAFTIHGRWMDDGQFIYPYYEYLLERAAEKVQSKVGFTMIC
jgi:hypothetical protein